MKKRVWKSIASIFIIIICFASIGAILQPDGSNNFIVAVISLAVALVAIYFSLMTYYSIDEVNAISRMDGNVMENPRYRPNILRFIFRFQQIDFSETSESLMFHMEHLFNKKNKQSGAHLADNVQEIADMMVLIPFFIQTNNQKASAMHLQRISDLLTIMKSHVNNFKEVSDGSCKLLEETVNLIDSVFAYQKLTASGKSDPSKLLEIRGSIFLNPATCILYNNYLGLYYLQRATTILCKHQTGLSLKQQIEHIKQCTTDEKSIALIYVDKASHSFKCAKDYTGDDMIWTAFICFNIARSEYIKHLLNNSQKQTALNDWESFINESIRCWVTSNQIIAEHFSSKIGTNQKTWLQQALISQENKVRLSKIIFQMAQKHPLTDYNGNHWITSYSDIFKTHFFQNIPEKDPQKRTDSLLKDILQLMEK